MCCRLVEGVLPHAGRTACFLGIDSKRSLHPLLRSLAVHSPSFDAGDLIAVAVLVAHVFAHAEIC